MRAECIRGSHRANSGRALLIDEDPLDSKGRRRDHCQGLA
jgi:hypothetical protein